MTHQEIAYLLIASLVATIGGYFFGGLQVGVFAGLFVAVLTMSGRLMGRFFFAGGQGLLLRTIKAIALGVGVAVVVTIASYEEFGLTLSVAIGLVAGTCSLLAVFLRTRGDSGPEN